MSRMSSLLPRASNESSGGNLVVVKFSTVITRGVSHIYLSISLSVNSMDRRRGRI